MRILMVGDVVGRSGRKAFSTYTPKLKTEKKIDVVIVNGENIAGGNGITHSTFMELLAGGADIVTSGNHIWDNREIFEFIDREPFLVRPANYPESVPGRGFCIFPYKAKNIGVFNLSGKTFMPPLDCPFSKATEIVNELKKSCDIIILDFHAEATSEKEAMAFYLDGKVDVIFGTHTHVQTADERILPNGTAYISDVGMVGSLNSVLGIKPEIIIKKFLTAMPVKFEVNGFPCVYSALLVDFDDKTNKPIYVERIYQIIG